MDARLVTLIARQLGLPLTTDDAGPAAAAPPSGPGSPPAPAPRPRDAGEPSILFTRRRGARRYILRVLEDGTLRVTLPWWGSQREARAFVASQHEWIAAQRARRAAAVTRRWAIGAEVLVDGVPQRLEAGVAGCVVLAGVAVSTHAADERALRADVHRWLRARAVATLPEALRALAATHAVTVTRISIRNQRSRWGSCSRRGGIALNWRLVQVPPFVRDYVLLHELMHRRELNHSARFWAHVAAVCPRHDEARRWLRVEGAQLFD